MIKSFAQTFQPNAMSDLERISKIGIKQLPVHEMGSFTEWV